MDTQNPTVAIRQDVFAVVLVIRLPTVQTHDRILQNARSARGTTLQAIKDVPYIKTSSVPKNLKVTLCQLTLDHTYQMLMIVIPLMDTHLNQSNAQATFGRPANNTASETTPDLNTTITRFLEDFNPF